MGDFYVQSGAKEPWHVESDEHCEVMLCGLVVSVDSPTVRIQTSWGIRKCPDCWIEWERLRRIRSLAPSRR